MVPKWLHILSITFLLLGALCVIVIATDIARQPQHMGILHTDTPEFWFMTQIAMLCGFATAYPTNWWLTRSGVKEQM